jgi:hypothetical protein
MIFVTDVFSKAWYVEFVIALLSLLENLPQMCLYEEPGGLDLSEVHVEGELIDHMIVLGRSARINVWLV